MFKFSLPAEHGQNPLAQRWFIICLLAAAEVAELEGVEQPQLCVAVGAERQAAVFM
jgi:hypothetical protein